MTKNKIPFPADAAERAEKIYATGKMDEDVAKELGVSRQIVYLWRSRYPEFDDACARGKKAGEKAHYDTLAENGRKHIHAAQDASRINPPDDAAETVEKLCSLGLTDQEIAGFFGHNLSVILRWRGEYSNIAAAFKSGKEIADERVERSLFHRATGYSKEIEKLVKDKDAENGYKILTFTENTPPDTLACIFWLKNRRPELWRDRREVMATGADGKNLNDLTSAELDQQVIEALKRSADLRRRIDQAVASKTDEGKGDDEPDRLH